MASLHLTAERLLHVLRHFEAVSPRVAARLRAAGLDDGAGAVAVAGSRFHPSLGDPMDVTEVLQRNLPVYRASQHDGSTVVTWEVSRAVYPEGVGTCGVTALDELPRHDRDRVVEEERVGMRVRVVTLPRAVATWTVTAVVEPEEGGVERVRALFPGPYAPPFPAGMEAGPWRDEAAAYWATHVLVRVVPAP